jgi:hypothetical protein
MIKRPFVWPQSIELMIHTFRVKCESYYNASMVVPQKQYTIIQYMIFAHGGVCCYDLNRHEEVND